MNRRDIVVGAVILAVLAGVVFWNRDDSEEINVPQTLSVEDKIEESFNLQIPDDVGRSELKDVSGKDASGIATRKYENGVFEHSVLTDLPDPEQGKFYQGWLTKGSKGEDDYSLVSVGKLRLAKGGYMLDYKSKTDYSSHNQVVVTLEEKFDDTPEEHVLEGSF
jgi:hypothetical protein